jgi:hypothetical protein
VATLAADGTYSPIMDQIAVVPALVSRKRMSLRPSPS